MGLACSWTFPTQAQGALKPHWKHVQDKQTRGILWLTREAVDATSTGLRGEQTEGEKFTEEKKSIHNYCLREITPGTKSLLSLIHI